MDFRVCGDLHGGSTMSKTLNFVERLWALGRKYCDLGLDAAATRILTRLTGLQDLPADIAHEIQERLAELFLKRQKYTCARRHLAAALALQPDNPRYHHRLASVLEEDPKGDPKRALLHYRRAARLDPDNGDILCDLGLFALEQGERTEGLEALRRAFERSPDDPSVVSKVAEGLRQQNEIDEARSVLRTALFRNPRDARFRKLLNDFQFQVLHTEQERARKAGWWGQEGPVILRFDRPEGKSAAAAPGHRILRRDPPKRPTAAPHLARTKREPGRKHAQ
jgi:Tfp pilus assembly protein PilF